MRLTDPSQGTQEPRPPDLLSPDTAIPYLRERGIVSERATATELGGGVSNVVLRVADGDSAYILKQSLPRLRVAEEWLAPQERIITEAEAMRLASTIVDDGVPGVLLSDPSTFVLVIESAPSDWTDWKTQLMAGEVFPSAAARVGATLGELHRSTMGTSDLSELLRATEPFEQLRLRPYYERAAQAVPEWSNTLHTLAQELRDNRRCLVHGDLSPKNVLVPRGGGDRAWVIDFEVAHRGDPRFDLAFLLTHLTLKSIHVQSARDLIDEAALAFLQAYEVVTADTLPVDLPGVARHVGALLLARVHGKSPVEYLSTAEQSHVVRCAGLALEGKVASIEDLFRIREDCR